jgi:hypothetical protein
MKPFGIYSSARARRDLSQAIRLANTLQRKVIKQARHASNRQQRQQQSYQEHYVVVVKSKSFPTPTMTHHHKSPLKLSSLLDHLLNVHATKFLPAKNPNFVLNIANRPLPLDEASATWLPIGGNSIPLS